jgi:uncharacterized protein (TIGR00255 family)
MTLQSMTGFGRSQGRAHAGSASGAFVWELRSVNGKGIDVRLKLPPGFENLEGEARRVLTARFSRGNIQAGLQFERDAGAGVPVVNEAALQAVLAAIGRVNAATGGPPPRAETILQIKGVLETGEAVASEEETESRNNAVLGGLENACAQLEAARIAEGKAVALALLRQVETISALVAGVEADPSRSPAAIAERLHQQLSALLPENSGLDPQRLHQEAALLATKADLREEIDRLNAHVAAAGTLLRGKGPAGRKLDFLAQEFNRECNTICSKSNAASVTAIGLEMKVVIDQFREQVQNIE